MPAAMTPSERDEFLGAVHVGVLAVASEGRGPIASPVWYAYEPGGEIVFTTGEHSAKARAMRAAGRATFTVQAEQPPYQYVTAEGPVTFGTDDTAVRRALAVRYLGEASADAFMAAGGGSPESVIIRLRPERWHAVDFGR